MPILPVSLTDQTYKEIMDQADKIEQNTGKRNVSAIVEAMLSAAALLTEESKRAVHNYALKVGTTDRQALNELITHGYNYWFVIKPDLLQKV